METLKSIRDAIKVNILDGSFDDDDIDKRINQGLLEIAGGATRDFDVPTIPPLPNLSKEFIIATVAGDDSVALPSDFHRGGKLGFTADGDQITYYDSFIKFQKAFFGETSSDVESYCIRGRKLYYYGSPATPTNIHLFGYSLPETLTGDDDQVVALPDHLQHRLLVNYVSMDCFSIIEQDFEGIGANYAKFRGLYEVDLTDLYSVISKDEEALYIEDDR